MTASALLQKKKKHPTWKSRWLKLILQKKPVYWKEWTTGHNSSLQIKWYTTLKNGPTQRCLKKTYTCKNLMLELDDLKSTCFQKPQHPERKLKPSTPKTWLWGERSFSESYPWTNVYNCSSKIFTILNGWLQLLLWNCHIHIHLHS